MGALLLYRSIWGCGTRAVGMHGCPKRDIRRRTLCAEKEGGSVKQARAVL